MKFLVLLIFLTSCSLWAQAALTPSGYLKSVIHKKRQSIEFIDKGSQVLAQFLKKKPMTKSDLSEALALALFLLKNDPSNYTAELMHPLYQTRKNEILELILKWPAKDLKLFLDAMQFYTDSLGRGNG